MKQALTFTALLSTVLLSASAQNFKQKFNDVFDKKDTAEAAKILVQWEAKSPNDPELYVAYFNYYVQKGSREMLALEREQKGDLSMELADSSGKVAGYMNGIVEYNDSDLKKVFEYIDKGIQTFPNRLDMRFGKIYMLGEQENYEAFTQEIIKTVDYSVTNNNAWLWTDDQKQKEPKEFLLNAMQTYVLQLYNTNDDKLLDNMKRISETILKHYPEHVESMSDLSIVYMINEEYDKALEQLLKAEKLAPTDYIVLNNIAEAYKRKGNKEQAIGYYEKVQKYGDEEAKAFAKKEIDKLK